MARQDFSPQTVRLLQARAACHCSNPDCRTIAIEPGSDEAKQTTFGEAAHLSAASEGGPRFDAGMTDDQRSAPDNGIWLCCNCHTKVDKDPDRYPIELLRVWKREHENWVRDSGDAPRLPQISVSTIDGLSTPPSGIEDVSADDAARLRESRLLLEFDRHGIVRELELECQLPEAVCWSRFYSWPAGCEVRFEPESPELIAIGAGVKVIGGAPPAQRWRLRVGTPHGRTRVDLRFRSFAVAIPAASRLGPLAPHSQSPRYWLRGALHWDFRGATVSTPVTVVLAYDPVSRELTSHPPTSEEVRLRHVTSVGWPEIPG